MYLFILLWQLVSLFVETSCSWCGILSCWIACILTQMAPIIIANVLWRGKYILHNCIKSQCSVMIVCVYTQIVSGFWYFLQHGVQVTVDLRFSLSSEKLTEEIDNPAWPNSSKNSYFSEGYTLTIQRCLSRLVHYLHTLYYTYLVVSTTCMTNLMFCGVGLSLYFSLSFNSTPGLFNHLVC